jgi:hypothetical protein
MAMTTKKAVFWDVKTQFVLHRRHITSATEHSRLMLCKIWGFHGSDYEECRPLRYKNSVRTSQETYYVSTTEPSLLIICKIWGFHGGDYEEWSLLGYKNPDRTSQQTHHVPATEPSGMPSSGMWRRVALVWTYFSEERIRVEGISEVGRTIKVTSNWSTLQYVPPESRS